MSRVSEALNYKCKLGLRPCHAGGSRPAFVKHVFNIWTSNEGDHWVFKQRSQVTLILDDIVLLRPVHYGACRYGHL